MPPESPHQHHLKSAPAPGEASPAASAPAERTVPNEPELGTLAPEVAPDEVDTPSQRVTASGDRLNAVSPILGPRAAPGEAGDRTANGAGGDVGVDQRGPGGRAAAPIIRGRRLFADDAPATLRLDDAMVWVDKPTGMLSVPGLGEANQDCIVRRLAQRLDGFIREAHRLDQDTSGVMLLARDRETHRELMRQFREREVKKRYEAIVLGRVDQQRGRVELPIRLDPDRRPRQVVDPVHGKPATTVYSVLGHFFLNPPPVGGNGFGRTNGSARTSAMANGRGSRFNAARSPVVVTRLRLVPFTGRTHQLRLHLAAIGHPILGDDLYGTAESLALADRLLLHATMLDIADPAAPGDPWSRPRIRVECPCPF